MTPDAEEKIVVDREEKIVFDPVAESIPNPTYSKHADAQSSSNVTPSTEPHNYNLPQQAHNYNLDQPRPIEPGSATSAKMNDPQLPAYNLTPNMTDAISPPTGPSSPAGMDGPQATNTSPQTTEQSSAPVQTVTPLRLLRDQPDTVDCPFCQRRAETTVRKHPSQKTHIVSAVLFFTTFFGVIAPYIGSCYYDSDHHCKACDRRVAHKAHDVEEPDVFGTPEHLREVSKYPPAPGVGV